MTQQEIAEREGVTQQTVSNGMPEKICKQKRQRAVIQIQSGTEPFNAAKKINNKFGPDYALALARALLTVSNDHAYAGKISKPRMSA